MGYTRIVSVGVAILAALMLLPVAAWAQGSSTIAGVVRDTTGAVLPGVTVEAASPALIEKVRTVVTDDQGLYKIVDLRPGTCSTRRPSSGEIGTFGPGWKYPYDLYAGRLFKLGAGSTSEEEIGELV